MSRHLHLKPIHVLRPAWRALAAPLFALIVILSLVTTSGVAFAAPNAAPPVPPDATLEEMQRLEAIESAYKPSYLGLATGNPRALPAALAAEGALATHSVYAWPFTLTGGLGWNMQSYQNYGGAPYFHHGIDMLAPNGTQVYNRSGGQVVSVVNYQPGNVLYWEVAVKDAEGYIWVYHHIDNTTIPQAIKNAYAAYQADTVNGGLIPADTYLGNIVYWTVVTFGYRFNHIHLNILGAGGAYLNPMEFMTPMVDTTAPQIQAIGLLKNNTVTAGISVSGDYGLYVRSKDLIVSTVYYLPPYKVVASVDGGQPYAVWEFANLPGGASDTAYLSDYYVVPPTCGDYSCREYYIDLGFTTAGQRAFPTTVGQHTISVTAYDYAGNHATSSFTYTYSTAPVYNMMVGDLDNVSTNTSTTYWAAKVRVLVHDQNNAPLSSVTVKGTWSNGTTGAGSCVTVSTGLCTITKSSLRRSTAPSAKFTVTGLTKTSYTYVASANHDPDGDSTGTVITVTKP